MKTVHTLLAATALSLSAAAATAADVGVSISIGQPGFYGQIDIGRAPAPQYIYSRPVVIEHVASPLPPLYLRVPPGHEKNWARYCRDYGACGRPVYFVRNDWYERVYTPYYREHWDRDHGRWRDENRNGINDRDERRGRGHDHGRGKGHDRDHDGRDDRDGRRRD
ncbi:MAG TPA: hypothetical protein VGE47_00545 [Burkholderiaceae bacterium]